MNLIDETKADEYLGKVVLLGITYVDHEDKLIEQKQWVGTIVAFSRKEGIRIRLRDSDSPCGLPPDERGIRKAPPGIYRLRSTGEEIENPDYLATWTLVSPDPNKEEPNQASEPTAPSGRGSP
jgi:hypothetical protein